MDTPAPTRRFFAGESLLAQASLLWLLVVWIFPFFPTQDGPDHLNNANILLRFLTDPHTHYRDFFWLDFSTGTNSFIYFFLAGLLLVFDPLVAEKILVSLYIVLYVCSVRYALGRADRSLGVLFLPYLFNLFTNFGFHGFMYGYCAFFLYYGSLNRWLDARRARHLLALAGAALLAFFFHVFAFWMMVAHFGASSAWAAFCESRSGPGNRAARAWGSLWRSALPPLAAFLPALALVLVFRNPASGGPLTVARMPQMLGGLLLNTSLYSFSRFELVLSGAYAAGILYVLARTVPWRTLSANPRAGALATALALVPLYALIPDYIHDLYFAGHRLNIFIYFLLLLAIRELPPAPGLQRGLRVLALAIGLGFLAVNATFYGKFNAQLQDYADMALHIPRESVVLNVSFAHKGVGPGNTNLSARVAPLEHASGLLAVRTNSVTLDNYEPCKAFSIIKYLPAMNPYEIIGDLDTPFYNPGRFDIDRYEPQTGRRIDAILLFGRGVHSYPRAVEARLDAYLERDYRLEATSKDGLLRLYRRNP